MRGGGGRRLGAIGGARCRGQGLGLGRCLSGARLRPGTWRLSRLLCAATQQRFVCGTVRVRESALGALAAAIEVVGGACGGARRGPPFIARELLSSPLRIPSRLTGGTLRILRTLLERPLPVLRALLSVALPVSGALLALLLGALATASR